MSSKGRGLLSEALKKQHEAAAARRYTCDRCKKERPRENFWGGDIYNRRQGLTCKICQPAPPAKRGRGRGHLSEALKKQHEAAAARRYTCDRCKTERARGNFWAGDISNRRQGLTCNVCQPRPTSERDQKGPGHLTESIKKQQGSGRSAPLYVRPMQDGEGTRELLGRGRQSPSARTHVQSLSAHATQRARPPRSSAPL